MAEVSALTDDSNADTDRQASPRSLSLSVSVPRLRVLRPADRHHLGIGEFESVPLAFHLPLASHLPLPEQSSETMSNQQRRAQTLS